MNIRSIVLLNFFIFCYAFHVNAEHTVSLDDVKVDIYNFGYYIQEVTNATGNPYFIGSIQKSIDYHAEPAVFSQDIGMEVSAFLKNNIADKMNGHALVVRINEIEISEKYNGVNESANAEVGLSFIYKEGDFFVEKFTCHAVKSYAGAMGVTKHQPELIGEAISECFDIFYVASYENRLVNDTISKSNLYQKPLIDEEHIKKLLAIDRSEKGLYNTFYHFKSNNPDTQTAFTVELKTKTNSENTIEIKSADIFETNTGKKIKDIWGFSDGRVSYVNVDNKFIPFEIDELGYYIELKVYDDDKMMNAAIWGGLIGSSIAAATTGKSKVRLDIVSGEFVYKESDDEGFPVVNKGFTRVIFYGSDFNATDHPLDLMINGKQVCRLEKSTWFETQLDTTASPEIVLRAQNGIETTEILEPPKYSTTVYLCIDKKKKAPKIDKVTGDKEEQILRSLNNSNRIHPPTQ